MPIYWQFRWIIAIRTATRDIFFNIPVQFSVFTVCEKRCINFTVYRHSKIVLRVCIIWYRNSCTQLLSNDSAYRNLTPAMQKSNIFVFIYCVLNILFYFFYFRALAWKMLITLQIRSKIFLALSGIKPCPKQFSAWLGAVPDESCPARSLWIRKSFQNHLM